MPKFINRACASCNTVLFTASKSKVCKPCFLFQKRVSYEKSEKEYLLTHGYSAIGDAEIDKFGHRSYKVLTPCGHEWEAPFNNLRKLIENAKAKNLRPACGTCGPKHRMKIALVAYVEKYGMDLETYAHFQEYSYKVRRTTEKTYRQHHTQLNPLNLKRGRKTYHLDHKVPIIECFKQGWPVERAAAVENLQLLKWDENLVKSTKYEA